MPVEIKEMLVAFFLGRVEVLIPKKRGEGFLKMPVGHHDNAISRFMRRNTSFDVSGLDGSLEIEIGQYHSIPRDKEQDFVRRNIQPLAEHLGFKVRIVSCTEYWAEHPTAKLTKSS